LLKKETPEFIPPYTWLPNSTDLNPVDYRVSEILQEMVFKILITDLDQQRLSTEWAELDYVVIAAAICQWHRR